MKDVSYRGTHFFPLSCSFPSITSAYWRRLPTNLYSGDLRRYERNPLKTIHTFGHLDYNWRRQRIWTADRMLILFFSSVFYIQEKGKIKEREIWNKWSSNEKTIVLPLFYSNTLGKREIVRNPSAAVHLSFPIHFQ